ncbi:cysteine-rich RLK (RECEPTOR-like protein kinase) 8 [Abeliophyllum distichum]|uniref:Cysteine-rich RLK (RECEPTOR-like protein kinase) 8 n=1 Tax=Abeliophyllum distichum TaxID=126358 RepID=A0ABD1SC68_9LAMI
MRKTLNPIDEPAHESSGGNEVVVENDEVIDDEVSQQPDLQPESSECQAGIKIWVDMPAIEEATDKIQHPMITRSKARIMKPRTYIDAANSQGSNYEEPVDFDEALKNEKWCKAMKEEYDALVDINNAFLNGKLEETVYIRQPQGFIDKSEPSFVCRLNKAIYGLKQAPRAWHDTLKETLLQWDLKQSKADNSVLYQIAQTHTIYLLVYVDDIILTESCKTTVQKWIDKLNASFTLNDMGTLKKFLGIEFYRDEIGLHLSQRKYATNVLK